MSQLYTQLNDAEAIKLRLDDYIQGCLTVIADKSIRISDNDLV